jgi:hypothetical protein
MIPIKKRLLTGKEANTEKAKRAELIRINFELTDNRISETGEKQIYIVVYGPDGNAFGTDKFKLSNGTEKQYTISKMVPYVQGQTTKNIALDWKPNSDKFSSGTYNVEIYHLGYLVGSKNISLK